MLLSVNYIESSFLLIKRAFILTNADLNDKAKKKSSLGTL